MATIEAALREHVHGVPWKDLVQLSRLDVAHELSISLPWLIGSWIAFHHGYYLAGLGCSFMFFLTGLRQVHNAYHFALGVSRAATGWIMFCMSILMLGSMHAVQINHLRHHRHCMQEDDVEAMSARMPGWLAILVGPAFPFRLHRKALELATARQRTWIVSELGANCAWIVLVFCVLQIPWLQYHVLAMVLGQSLTSFFAVWTVHHDCGAQEPMARTIRGRLKAFACYSMFFHLEHHLFPAVPTRRLAVLARRIDSVAPVPEAKRVF